MTARFLLLGAVLTSLWAVGPAYAAFPGKNGTLVFTDLSERPECDDSRRTIDCGLRSRLFSAGPAGERPRALTVCSVYPCDVARPAWSATGRRLAFERYEGGPEIMIRDSRGGYVATFDAPRELTRITEPTFSPDGRRLLVTGYRSMFGPTFETSSYVSAIYVTDRVGARFRRLTAGPYDSAPAWSSKGRIAFERARSHEDPDSGNVFTVLPSGKGLRQVTRRGGGAPSWSPRAGRIAFERLGDLFTVRPDGRAVRHLTRSGDDSEPAWSPNGRLIAFVRDDSIFTIRPNDRDPRRIVAARGTASLSGPEWRPLPR